MWQDVIKAIETNESFLITAHVNPDGDAIGSQMALKLFLEQLDKSVIVVNASPTPASLTFLDPEKEIKIFGQNASADILEDLDAVLILDLNNWEQLASMARPIQKHSTLLRVCIDHHRGATADFADISVTDTSSAATGMLIMDLIQTMDGKITQQIAEALYAAIITDTGTFRFTNTDARVLTAAATLVSAGANPHDIHRKVFASKSWGVGRLLGPVMSNLDHAADGRLAWIHATQEMVKAAGATYDDMDGFVDLIRAIKQVQLVLFFKETPDGNIKVSLRSNGTVDAYAIAASFGGGGHKMAAGMRLDGPMERAIKQAVDVCVQMDGIRAD